ncbi:MAG: hypothetical protein J1E95_07875 [Muribaculaceae bacterium]|nr:hypothetical protein [Muribaculaceae bacterium]
MTINGCGDNETFEAEKPSPLAINMTIAGKATLDTRANRLQIEDKWSYVSFEKGDAMGFFASGGNWQDDTSGMFDNYELVYDGKSQFKDPDGSSSMFSPSEMKGNEVYMYYPYSPLITSSGMELRVKPENGQEGWRCMDYLAANYINMEGQKDGGLYALYGDFLHGFAELIIMRGKGFDNPPAGCERITAVIDIECTHIMVEMNTENGWSCRPKLIFSPSNSAGLKLDESKEWDAWQGGNYGITDKDPIGKEAWYVIVPTLGGNERTTVTYIEICDNEGNWQHVTGLKLSGYDQGNPTKFVDPGWRYPMEITMNELVPSVNPYPISPWGEVIDLTDQRKRGISDLTEFEQWVRDYNAYIADPSKSDPLFKYGDQIVEGDNDNISWHFYLLSDLDLSGYQALPWDDNDTGVSISNNIILPNFKDILDGKSTTFVNGSFINHKITGLNKTFVASISGGMIENIDFIEPKIISPDSSSDSAGIIALNMTGATVMNCNIEMGTLMNPGGAGGMIAGYMSGGTIRNTSASGWLIAASTANLSINEAGFIGVIDNLVTAVFEKNTSKIVQN